MLLFPEGTNRDAARREAAEHDLGTPGAATLVVRVSIAIPRNRYGPLGAASLLRSSGRPQPPAPLGANQRAKASDPPPEAGRRTPNIAIEPHRARPGAAIVNSRFTRLTSLVGSPGAAACRWQAARIDIPCGVFDIGPDLRVGSGAPSEVHRG
jgi:hypothetical protein